MSNVTELATGQLTATETQAGAGRSAMNRNTDWTTALLLAWNWALVLLILTGAIR